MYAGSVPSKGIGVSNVLLMDPNGMPDRNVEAMTALYCIPKNTCSTGSVHRLPASLPLVNFTYYLAHISKLHLYLLYEMHQVEHAKGDTEVDFS